ncbi:MAG: SMC-Scp complex subunit ScpB [Porticoccaceae bacterium]
MDSVQLKKIIEGALLAAARPLDIPQLETLFADDERPSRDELRAALDDIAADCREHGYELVHVASGYRFQVRQEIAPWINRLWDEKPRKYTRALLETLAVIAYRQPVTRGDIEQIRGVAVSSDTVRTLFERDWIRTVGHRDVPGRPALYATTKQFLDYFNLQALEQLPSLGDIRDLVSINSELEFGDGEVERSGGDAPRMDLTEQTDTTAEGEAASGTNIALFPGGRR